MNAGETIDMNAGETKVDDDGYKVYVVVDGFILICSELVYDIAQGVNKYLEDREFFEAPQDKR